MPQHETILADLNHYKATTRLVILLTDNAIKQICIGPLVCHNKYKPYNLSTSLQQFLTFLFTIETEREAVKDERTHQGAMDIS